jgi:hypothetical protein
LEREVKRFEGYKMTNHHKFLSYSEENRKENREGIYKKKLSDIFLEQVKDTMTVTFLYQLD